MDSKTRVRDGYKMTALGWIPEEWEVKSIQGCISLSSGKSKPYDIGPIKDDKRPFPVYGGNGINGYSSQFNISGENIIIGRVGEYCGVTRYLNTKAWITDNALVTKTLAGGICAKFLTYELQHVDLSKLRSKGGQPLVSQQPIYSHKILIPPLAEQRGIAGVLGCWDKAIGHLEGLVRAKEARKRWLMQVLLTGKKRLPGFEGRGAGQAPMVWKVVRLGDVFTKVRRPVEVKAEESYKEIGIRSHGKGIFFKPEVNGKKLGEKSVFEIVPNCLIVNIVFAWEQAVARTTDEHVGCIASHRFPMYLPDSKSTNLDFVLSIFKTSRGKSMLELASPGGAGRNKTLGQEEFEKLTLRLPSLAEQNAVAKVLSASDREIALLRGQLAALKTQKQGLMQVLLTGKVRVGHPNSYQ